MSKTAAILITLFLGGLGVHRFMTGGCFGIGWLIDLIKVCTGSFTDKNGEVWGV